MLTTRAYRDAIENKIRNKKSSDLQKSFLEPGLMAASKTYALPKGFEGDYLHYMRQENLFRRLGTVLTLNNPDGNIGVMEPLGDAKITHENEVYPTFAPDFLKLNYHSHKLALLSMIPKTFVEDMNFDLCGYIYKAFGESFGKAEENVCLNGTGQDEPLGLLRTAEIGVTTSKLETDAVIELFFSLDSKYRRNAVWLMNDETAMALRLMKDSSGGYIWRITDDNIFSRPVIISNYITDSTIAFGDISYYWLMERQALGVKFLHELYALNGGIGLAATERLDGRLVRKEAVKVLKLSVQP